MVRAKELNEHHHKEWENEPYERLRISAHFLKITNELESGHIFTAAVLKAISELQQQKGTR